MSSEQELQKRFEEYRQLAQENKNIDVSALMLQALENQHKNMLSSSQRKWGYWVSVGLPPFGLIFAAAFYFSGKDDAKRAAAICILLTIFSGVLAYVVIRLMFSSAGLDPSQLQQAPQQLQNLIGG